MSDDVPSEAPETPQEAPRLWDWFWLADRAIGALEALAGAYATYCAHLTTGSEEQHECRALFLGESKCHVCGRDLNEPGEGS